MVTNYGLRMPHGVYGGENPMDSIPRLVGKASRIVLFTDRGVREAGLLERPLAQLEKTGAGISIIDDLVPEPDYETAQGTIDRFRALGGDYIVAVGGGSVMDIAKLASILADGRIRVKELFENPLLGEKTVRTLMIPTTAGTGSEATANSILAIPEKEVKVGIVNPEMIADTVILDAEMIRRLPRKIAAATGVDALAHAIECYTSNKANPISDLFSLNALEMIMKNIEAACNEADNRKAKETMLLASFYGGAAISCSGTTAVHALSYPLGGKYHIPHGVSNAIMLAPVMRFNEPFIRERLAAAWDRLFGGDSGAKTPEEKSEALLVRLEEIVKNLDIPTNLSGFGVSRKELDVLVSAGMEQQRLLVNNMRPVTHEDARALYLSVLP